MLNFTLKYKYIKEQYNNIYIFIQEVTVTKLLTSLGEFDSEYILKQINISKNRIFNSAFTAAQAKFIIYKKLEIDNNIVIEMLNKLVKDGKLKIVSGFNDKTTQYKRIIKNKCH